MAYRDIFTEGTMTEIKIDEVSPEAKSRVAELLSRYTNTTREQVIESLLAEQARLNVEKK